MEYGGAEIQILDLPGIIEGAAEGKGRGRQVISAAKTSDLIMMVLGAAGNGAGSRRDPLEPQPTKHLPEGEEGRWGEDHIHGAAQELGRKGTARVRGYDFKF
jgi:hypothetical protein